MSTNKYELHCNGDKFDILPKKGESVKDALLRELGWLIYPLIEETNSFEGALDILRWKIKYNENDSNP
jgi:hypothetical protein